LGYILTEKGEQELDLYSGTDEDELRLNVRTLVIPLLEEVRWAPDISPSELASVFEGTLSKAEVSGVIGNAVRLGFLERRAPGPEASSDEIESWKWHLSNQGKPRLDSPEVRKRSLEKYKERYPEAARDYTRQYERDLSDPEDKRARSRKANKVWKEKHPEDYKERRHKEYMAYQEENKLKAKEYRERKKDE